MVGCGEGVPSGGFRSKHGSGGRSFWNTLYRASGCLKGSGREIEECSECKRIAFSILYVIGEGENG